jgi:hypothetical protein
MPEQKQLALRVSELTDQVAGRLQLLAVFIEEGCPKGAGVWVLDR